MSYTLLSTLETRLNLTSAELYKLLVAAGLTPKNNQFSFYLDEQEVGLLDRLMMDLRTSRPKLSLCLYLQGLEEAAFLYECSNCGTLWVSSKLLHSGNENLLHACPRTLGYKQKFSGTYELAASGPLSEILEWARSKRLGLDKLKSAI